MIKAWKSVANKWLLLFLFVLLSVASTFATVSPASAYAPNATSPCTLNQIKDSSIWQAYHSTFGWDSKPYVFGRYAGAYSGYIGKYILAFGDGTSMVDWGSTSNLHYHWQIIFNSSCNSIDWGGDNTAWTNNDSIDLLYGQGNLVFEKPVLKPSVSTEINNKNLRASLDTIDASLDLGVKYEVFSGQTKLFEYSFNHNQDDVFNYDFASRGTYTLRVSYITYEDLAATYNIQSTDVSVTTGAIPESDVDMSFNIRVTGSLTAFSAQYINTVTSPSAPIPDPEALMFTLVDLDQATTQETTGFHHMCPTVLIQNADSFSFPRNCPNVKLNPSHNYAVMAGYTMNLSWGTYLNGDSHQYNITYKIVSVTLPKSGAFDVLTGDSDKSDCIDWNAGDYGLGQRCTIAPIVRECTISNLTDPAQYAAFIGCEIGNGARLFGQAVSILFTPTTNFQDYFSKTFDFGVINPSITAIRQLLSAFIVSTSQCSLTVSNAQVSGKTFPVSSLIGSSCAAAYTMRTSFPVVPSVVNFLMALLLIAYIAKIINTLLHPDETDVIVTFDNGGKK